MICAEDILAQVGKVTPLPATAARLISVLNNPRSTVQDVVEVIKYDPAETGRLLRMCNSAYYGLSRQIHSLKEAVCYLGTKKVLQLMLASHGGGPLKKEQRGYGLDPGILWKQSVAVALAASQFGQKICPDDAGLAFTAGLLHDIGKVVLNEYVGREFAEIAGIVSRDRCSFIEAERQVLGFSHEEIGEMVAEKWKLPKPLVRCIRYHHEPDQLDPPDPLVDTVYLADSVCMLLGIGLGADELHYRADQTVMKRHGLTEADLEFAGAMMLSELKEVEELFNLTASAGADRQGAET